MRATRVLGLPYRVDCPSQRMGALGAAHVPVGLGLGAEGWRLGCAPSAVALLLAASASGERGAVVVAAPAGWKTAA